MRILHRYCRLILLVVSSLLIGCVNLAYVEELGKQGKIWSEESIVYIDAAEQAHNAAYQYRHANDTQAPKCQDGFRLCLRSWEKNAKGERFGYLREVLKLMLVYTETLRSLASNAPLDEIKKRSEKLNAQILSTQSAYQRYLQDAQISDNRFTGDFDVVGQIIYGISRISFDYQRDAAIRTLVINRYENIHRALLLYEQALLALIDSTQVIAGDLHGSFEQFVSASWEKSSAAERLLLMQESVAMNKLQENVYLKKECPLEQLEQCQSNSMLREYKPILHLQTLLSAHDKLFEAAKSDLPLDFEDFKDLVHRLGDY